jgi:hypothetical protein
MSLIEPRGALRLPSAVADPSYNALVYNTGYLFCNTVGYLSYNAVVSLFALIPTLLFGFNITMRVTLILSEQA